jgi:hypothetical protein
VTGRVAELRCCGESLGWARGSLTATMPGQDTFGAIQEIVQIFDADAKTDWSKVDSKRRVSTSST